MSSKRVVIYGGNGQLGSKCVTEFKEDGYWVAVIAFNENSKADLNISLGRKDTFEQQESKALEMLSSALGDTKLEAVICVAGGWIGGNAKKRLIENCDRMLRASLWTSLICASIAAQYLKEGGLLMLTGSKAALECTPTMIGYGVAKAAVHQLVKSLSASNSGLPDNTCVIGILPSTLDTSNNRKSMPHGELSAWTSLEYVTSLILNWASGKERPTTGSLLKLETNNFNTDLVPCES